MKIIGIEDEFIVLELDSKQERARLEREAAEARRDYEAAKQRGDFEAGRSGYGYSPPAPRAEGEIYTAYEFDPHTSLPIKRSWRSDGRGWHLVSTTTCSSEYTRVYFDLRAIGILAIGFALTVIILLVMTMWAG